MKLRTDRWCEYNSMGDLEATIEGHSLFVVNSILKCKISFLGFDVGEIENPCERGPT